MNGRRGIVTILISAALITGLVGQLPSASAAKKKKKKVERTESRAYVGATGVRGASDSPCAGEPVGCVVFPVEAAERYVSIEIVDQAGQPVWASVYIYGYTDGTDVHEHVCGASEAPLQLMSDLEELVVITTQTTGGATNPCAGPATAGEVVATFSNIR